MVNNEDDMYTKACKLLDEGNMWEAELLYRAVLKTQPRHSDALHQLGALLIQQYGKNKYEEGRSLVQAAINDWPSCPKYRQSLGVLYQSCGKKEEAVEAFERANEKDPMNTQTLMALARSLGDIGRNMRAAEVYKSVVLLDPDHPQAYYRRATCLRAAGRIEDATASLRQHLRLFPNDVKAQFWIAAMSGNMAATQSKMPDNLVASLFDQYASRFDEHLVNTLQYRTPQALIDAIMEASSSSPRPRWQRCADLGCGTGLMGPLLRPLAEFLEGVDLSEAMVDKAREKGCYDRLTVAELVAYIETCNDRCSTTTGTSVSPQYDILVAADVFVYIGDLEPVMSSASNHCSKGAMFAFSTESLERMCNNKGVNEVGYALAISGRYAHSRPYLERLAVCQGWKVCLLIEQIIRYNAGQPVHGYLCVLEKVR